MFGAIPALLTFYWRMRLPETARYTALVGRNLKQAVSDMNKVLDIDINDLTEEEDANMLARQDSFGLFSSMFMRRHGWHLLSTTVCWFMLDVVFYTLNLFMIDIFTAETNWFGDAKKEGILEQTHKIAKIQALIAVSGTLPGYFFTVMFVDSIGRIAIQLMGFAIMTIFILFLAAMNFSKKAGSHLPIGFAAVIYGCIFFFTNFGPNSTTFIVPTEIFPTRLRSTCHGIAGAEGKAGAIVGVLLFLYAGDSIPLKLLMLAGCNLVGIVFTVFLPESKRMSLEDITGEIKEEMEHETEQR
jgi:PHS family inorganic phosphate transporter-like MFS transporter